MSDIMDILSGAIGNDAVKKIGGQLGIDSGTTSTIVNAALPLLVSALAKNSSSQQGAEELHNAVTKDHDGSILDNIGGLLGGSLAGNGGGILGHILGNKREQIQQGLGASTGVDSSTVGSVLELSGSGGDGSARTPDGHTGTRCRRSCGNAQRRGAGRESIVPGCDGIVAWYAGHEQGWKRGGRCGGDAGEAV